MESQIIYKYGLYLTIDKCNYRSASFGCIVDELSYLVSVFAQYIVLQWPSVFRMPYIWQLHIEGFLTYDFCTLANQGENNANEV